MAARMCNQLHHHQLLPPEVTTHENLPMPWVVDNGKGKLQLFGEAPSKCIAIEDDDSSHAQPWHMIASYVQEQSMVFCPQGHGTAWQQQSCELLSSKIMWKPTSCKCNHSQNAWWQRRDDTSTPSREEDWRRTVGDKDFWDYRLPLLKDIHIINDVSPKSKMTHLRLCALLQRRRRHDFVSWASLLMQLVTFVLDATKTDADHRSIDQQMHIKIHYGS